MNHDGTFFLNTPEPGDFDKALKWLRLVGNQAKAFTYEEIHGRLKPSDKKRHKKASAAARRKRQEKKRLKELTRRGDKNAA